MNEHAGREQEIEARHHACSYLPSAVEICTVCFLLAQLREARKKLVAVEVLKELPLGQTPLRHADWLWLRGKLDRILKGGD